MKRKIFLTLAILLAVLASTSLCFAANATQTKCADALYELGLFSGSGTNKDGTPIYSLEKAPTRAEAITMLVRLLGKEEEAKSQTWETPFTDVPTWAEPYVGYAYNNNLTTGISATTFGSTNKASEAQYITFILRALGYSDDAENPNRDFSWNTSKTLSNDLGITFGDANTNFLRGDVVEISYYALKTATKNSTDKLIDVLYKNNAVSTTTMMTVNREKKSADGTKIYLPDEACEGVSYKDLARACGCSEDLYYIVNPKTEADHINNTKYCVLTGNWSYVHAYNSSAARTSWGNCTRTIAGELAIYGKEQYAQLFGVFGNYWCEFYHENGQYYLYTGYENPPMTPQLVQQYIIDAYKIIEAKHNEFYSSGILNSSSSEYEIAKAYSDWFVELYKTSAQERITFPDGVGRQMAYGFVGLKNTNCEGRAAAIAMALNYEGIHAYGMPCGFVADEYNEHVVAWAILDSKEYICEPINGIGLAELGPDCSTESTGGPSSISTGTYLSPYLIAMARKEMGLSYDANYDITSAKVQANLPKYTARATDIPFTVQYKSTDSSGTESYLVKIDASYQGDPNAKYQVWVETKTGGITATISNPETLKSLKAGITVRVKKELKLRYVIWGANEFTIHAE